MTPAPVRKPISTLFLFPLTTRAQSPNAPPATADPQKSWVDPKYVGSTSQDEVVYQSYDYNFNLISVRMTQQRAGSLNLPGAPPVSVYAATPTPATMQVHDKTAPPIPLDPELLSTYDQARAMAVEMGVPDTLSTAPAPTYYDYEWNGETRMEWQIILNGLPTNVGKLIAAKARSVSAPAVPNPGPEGPIPMRLMVAGIESPAPRSMMDMTQAILVGAAPVVDPGSGTGGGVSQAVTDALARIEAKVAAIGKVFGIQ